MLEKGGFWQLPTASWKELRIFCVIMIVGCSLFSILLWYNQMHRTVQILSAAACLHLLGLVYPPIVRPVYVVWMLTSRVLGFVNTHLLLAFVFYTMFAAIGLAMRLFGRDPLDRKIEPDRDSYWERRSPTLLPRDHYERQF